MMTIVDCFTSRMTKPAAAAVQASPDVEEHQGGAQMKDHDQTFLCTAGTRE